MTATQSLADFVRDRIEEDELLARALDDAAALAACARRRRYLATPSRGAHVLLGLDYMDHPGYRYEWMV